MDSSAKIRVAIIGCGYVGSALGETLARGGHDVVGTTRSADRAAELQRLGIRHEIAEIADQQRLREIFADRDAVYLTVAPRRHGEQYHETFLRGVRTLLAAARSTPVRRIIYTSSTRVYGQDDGSWVDESSPTEPRDEPGLVLLEAERALLNGAGGLATGLAPSAAPRNEAPGGSQPVNRDGERMVCATVVRLGGIYGPGRDSTRRILASAGTRREDGDRYINMIHLEDIVAALAALLDVRHHGVLNLSDDEPALRCEYYDRVLSQAGLPPICWVRGDGPVSRGKRIRNDLIKRTLDLALKHPTH